MSGVPQRKASGSSMGQSARDAKKTLSVTVRSTFNRQQGSASTKNVPMYVNVTGPGDYDVPNFLQKDFTEADSQKRTAPCFTLAPKTKQPYWPQYEVDFKGSDSPGMTLYNPRKENVNDRDPAYTVAKDRRFTGIEERNRDKLANLPTQYHDHSSFDKTKTHGFSMSTGKTWTLKMSKEDETTPGPVY